jgi:hypothetical protein
MKPIQPLKENTMSNDIETTDDTKTVTAVAASVATEVIKELAITVTGCGVALALTAGVNAAAKKVRAHRAAKKSTDGDDKVATAIV